MGRKHSYVFSAAAATAALSGIPGITHYDQAQAATAAYFAFENPTFASFNASTATYAADFSGTGTFSGVHAGTSVWSQPAGNGSVGGGSHAMSSNDWAVGDYYQFAVPTTTLTQVIVQFDQVSSSTGPGIYTFEYSADGVNFSTFGNYTIPLSTSGAALSFAASSTPGLTQTFDLSSVPAMAGNANATFRIVDASTQAYTSTNPVATGGTDRIDNFQVVDSVPEPTGLALMTVATSAALIRRRRS